MFCLIEAVEIVVRRHLNVSNVHTLGGDFDYKEVILSEALGSKKVYIELLLYQSVTALPIIDVVKP